MRGGFVLVSFWGSCDLPPVTKIFHCTETGRTLTLPGVTSEKGREFSAILIARAIQKRLIMRVMMVSRGGFGKRINRTVFPFGEPQAEWVVSISPI